MAPAPAWATRPLDTEDTGTVAARSSELELSADFADTSAREIWVAPHAVLSVGIVPRLEVRLESSLLVVDPDHAHARAGLGDSLFGVKFRLHDESPTLPAVLGEITVRLPTGDESRGLGLPGTDILLLAAVSKTLGAFTITSNLGYTFVPRDRGLEFWWLATSLEYRATESTWIVGEAVSTLGVDRLGDALVLRAGGAWAVMSNLRLDCAIGAGLTRISPDVSVTVGLTLRLY